MPAGLGRRATEVGVKPSASSCSPLPPPLANLLDELAADHAFGEEVVTPMRAVAVALDREADDNLDAANLLQALALVAAQPRPARDRFIDIGEIVQARGRVTVTIRKPS
jgi:hypothetical protein